MIFQRNYEHYFSAKQTPGESVPQIRGLIKLSSSVVSGKPNSDYNAYIHFNFLHCDLLKYDN